MGDGTILGFKVDAFDDAGAYLHYEPLGAVIWSQVVPGCYKLKHIRVDYTETRLEQVPDDPQPRVLAAAAPVDDRADRSTSSPTSSASTRSSCASATTCSPRTTPTRRRTAASTTPATCRARSTCALEAIDYPALARAPARARHRQRQAHRHRHRHDARLGHQQLRPVADHQPGAAVLGQRRGGVRASSTSTARSTSTSARRRRARATRRPRRRWSPTSSACRPTRSRSSIGFDARHNTYVAFSGHLRLAVRGDRPRRRDGRRREAARRDRQGRARSRSAPRRTRSSCATAPRYVRGDEERDDPVHRHRQPRLLERRRAAGRARRLGQPQLPPRLPAAVRGARPRGQDAAT